MRVYHFFLLIYFADQISIQVVCYSIQCPKSSCVAVDVNKNVGLTITAPKSFFTMALRVYVHKSPCGKSFIEEKTISTERHFEKGKRLFVNMNLPCDGTYEVEVREIFFCFFFESLVFYSHAPRDDFM